MNPSRTTEQRGLSAFPDELVDQIVQPGYCLCLAAGRMGQDPARQVRQREREEQAIKVRLNGTGVLLAPGIF